MRFSSSSCSFACCSASSYYCSVLISFSFYACLFRVVSHFSNLVRMSSTRDTYSLSFTPRPAIWLPVRTRSSLNAFSSFWFYSCIAFSVRSRSSTSYCFKSRSEPCIISFTVSQVRLIWSVWAFSYRLRSFLSSASFASLLVFSSVSLASQWALSSASFASLLFFSSASFASQQALSSACYCFISLRITDKMSQLYATC